MAIKYANEIVKEIEERGEIQVPDGCVTGEEFEKWLRDKNKYNKGDIVSYRDKKAKVIGVSKKSNKVRYKLRLYDKFNTILYNIRPKEINK